MKFGGLGPAGELKRRVWLFWIDSSEFLESRSLWSLKGAKTEVRCLVSEIEF